MRLYYMTALQWGIKSLSERRLKIARYDDLNDPFELLCFETGEQLNRKFVKSLKTYYSKNKGVVCMSDRWTSPVMWAHYGDKHKGVCLGFDVPTDQDVLHSIDYNASRLKLEIDLTKPKLGLTHEILMKGLCTKAEEWQYEHEYRMMANLDDQDSDGHYYVDFYKDLVLAEVVLGCRCPISVGKVAKEVHGNTKPVTVIKLRPAFNAFEMVRNKSVKSITVKPGAVRK